MNPERPMKNWESIDKDDLTYLAHL